MGQRLKDLQVRALIKVLDSPSIGMGHVVRSLELAEELRRRGVVVTGFLHNGNRQSQEKIRSKGFGCISGHWANGEMVEEDLVRAVALEEIDIVILDQPGDLSDLCRALKVTFPHLFIVALDNFALDNEHLDVLVNLFNHNPTLKVPTSERVRYYEGVQYSIIRAGFDAYIGREKTIHPRAGNILVSFGGSDPKHNTLRVIEALRDGFPMEVTFHFVLGINFAHREIVKQSVRQLNVKSYFHENVANIQELMHHCDMGLCGAGTTMMEMACLGTPAIVLAQSENEARFADHFARHGVVRNLGLADKVPVEKVREVIIELAEDQTIRQNMSIAGKCLVDGRGRERVAELIVRDYSLFRGKYG